mmetsp:Transcript_31192/g.72711  ORF Transcript_31192/g.72711 Transcript_31192/m.72711 type:complete len:508 (-) Transcript_31192:166-1689(-)
MPEPEEKVDGLDVSTEVFIGSIKSYNERRGFGFITCEEITKRYGRDAYLAKEEALAIAKEPLPGQTIEPGEEEPPLSVIKEGDLVQFQVQKSTEGFPQAVRTRRAPAAGSTAPVGLPAVPDGLPPKPEESGIRLPAVGGAVTMPPAPAQAPEPIAPSQPPTVAAPGGLSLAPSGLSAPEPPRPEPKHVLSSLRPSSAAAPAFTPGGPYSTPAPPPASIPAAAPTHASAFAVGMPPPPSWRTELGTIIPAPCAPELLPYDETEAGTRSVQIQWPTVVHATAYTVELWEDGTSQPECFKRSVPDSVAELVVELRVGNLGVRAYACRIRCLGPCGSESLPSDWSFLPPSWFYPPPNDPNGWTAQIFPQLVSQNVGHDYSHLLGPPPLPAVPPPMPTSIGPPPLTSTAPPLLSTNPSAAPPLGPPVHATIPPPAVPPQPVPSGAAAAAVASLPALSHVATPPPPSIHADATAGVPCLSAPSPPTASTPPPPTKAQNGPSPTTPAEEALILD